MGTGTGVSSTGGADGASGAGDAGELSVQDFQGTVDDAGSTSQLIEQMKAHLPIPALPSREMVQTLRRQGVRSGRSRPVMIQRVYYLGDEGGICCDVSADIEKTHLVVSLTHLHVDPAHALAAEIGAYQRYRALQIAVRRL